MSIFQAIKAVFAPQIPDIGELATGLCVLPAPKRRQSAAKPEKAADMYVIDEVKNEYGFHSATATRQLEGSEPDLTETDISLLIERGYWGKDKKVNAQNAACKRAWHQGNSEKEAAAALNLSVSWIEKRYGTFATALLQNH